MTTHVVSEADVEPGEHAHAEVFAGRSWRLGDAAGSEALGCTLYEIPPGKSAYPYHYHTANEEALYVLAGAGTLRTPSGEGPLGAGDYVAFPAGEAGAHRVTNDGDEPLRYLMVSTMRDPEVLVYPDSNKVGVRGYDTDAPNRNYLADSDVDYWEGETE